MSAKTQHNNILLAIIGFTAVVVVVGVIGFLAIGREPEVIQGQVEVSEYRVSSKVPGRILEIRVKEGDFVKVGDTLAILDAPEVRAKMEQARSAENAAAAQEEMARNGARQEQIQGAFQLMQQAKAGLEIAQKSYQRVQRLFDEGVLSEQKRTIRLWKLSTRLPRVSIRWLAMVPAMRRKRLLPLWSVAHKEPSTRSVPISTRRYRWLRWRVR